MNLDRIELELEQMERNGKILRGYIVLGNVLCGIILLAVAIFAPHAVNAPPPVMKVRVMVGVLGLILFGIAIAIRRVKPSVKNFPKTSQNRVNLGILRVWERESVKPKPLHRECFTVFARARIMLWKALNFAMPTRPRHLSRVMKARKTINGRCSCPSFATPAGDSKMTEKTAAEFVMKTLRDAGFEAFLVGGVVRDLVLGRDPHDYDVTTNARPEQVAPLFAKTTPVGAASGVVVVVLEDVQIQVATYRADGDYSDGRRPDTVSYSDTAKEDVVRRDFTMNGLLIASGTGAEERINAPLDAGFHLGWVNDDSVEDLNTVVDYVNGLSDIRNQLIRCIGNPFDRFKEDALRMLRAVRFAATLGFTIEGSTYDAIVANVDLIRNVSRERIREELEKLVAAPFPTKGLVPLVMSGLFDAIFHQFAYDLRFQCTLQRFNRFAAVGNPKLGMAMLFADCPDDDAVVEAMESLKFSSDDYRAILGAVRSQKSLDSFGTHDGEVKLLAREPGVLEFGLDLFEQTAYLFFKYNVDKTTEHLSRFRSLTPEDIRPVPMVTGKDLIAMGFTPGPLFTRILGDVEYHQLNGDFESTEQALEYAKTEAEDMMGLYNMLFGDGRAPIYLACLGLTPGDVGRFRDCYLKDGMIVVYTRNGGGNREDYMPDFSDHPQYMYDEDDDFDCTYATIYFSYPPDYADVLKSLEGGEENIVPSEKWKTLLESMQNGK